VTVFVYCTPEYNFTVSAYSHSVNLIFLLYELLKKEGTTVAFLLQSLFEFLAGMADVDVPLFPLAAHQWLGNQWIAYLRIWSRCSTVVDDAFRDKQAALQGQSALLCLVEKPHKVPRKFCFPFINPLCRSIEGGHQIRFFCFALQIVQNDLTILQRRRQEAIPMFEVLATLNMADVIRRNQYQCLRHPCLAQTADRPEGIVR